MCCSHLERTFDSGYEVCLNCAHVKSETVVANIDHFIPSVSSFVEEEGFRGKNYEILLDFTANSNLPRKYADFAYKTFLTQCNGQKKNFNDANVHAKLMASMYDVLQRNSGTIFIQGVSCFQ